MKQEHPMTPGVLVSRVPGGAHPLYPTLVDVVEPAPQVSGQVAGVSSADPVMNAAALQASDPWKPSDGDYDRAIHHNPDAKAWADLFVQIFPGLFDKHDLMIGWFANAMMAMHDHLAQKAAQQAEQEWTVCLVGMRGGAYDTPETKRAYTYAQQPNDIHAYRLGMASYAAATASAGDAGFGVFQIGAEFTAPPAPDVKGKFTRGDTDATGDCGAYKAGITHVINPTQLHTGRWYNRIEVYGNTPEDAEALRDCVLAALPQQEDE